MRRSSRDQLGIRHEGDVEAGMAPNMTCHWPAVPEKSWPWMVTVVPPAVEPEVLIQTRDDGRRSTASKSFPSTWVSACRSSSLQRRRRRAAEIPAAAVVGHDHAVVFQGLEDHAVGGRKARDVETLFEPEAFAHSGKPPNC